jgi:uncharacterized protein
MTMTKWNKAMTAGVLVWMCGAAPLWALSLEDAKAQGLVGEQTSGYLGVVKPEHDAAQALAKEVNAKRRHAYEEIARRNGTQLQAVESLAGEKAIQNTRPGHFVEAPGGWIKK